MRLQPEAQSRGFHAAPTAADPDTAGQSRTGSRIVMLVSLAEILGGAERSLLSLAESLPGHGWTPVLVCPPGALAESGVRSGLRVATLPLHHAGPVSRRVGHRKTYSARAVLARSSGSIRNALLLARSARKMRPGIIHSNSLPSHLPVVLCGRIVRRPALLHLREIIEPGSGRILFSPIGRLASGMVAISEAVAEAVRHPDVVTVYNPVAAPPARVQAISWGLPPPIIGFMGRLDPGKGLEDLILAVGQGDGHLVVVGRAFEGTAAYVAALHELARSAAPGRVHFVGHVTNPWQALAAMDVLVVPSLAEPFGRVAAEGQRAGVPVLAARAGGLPEIVTDEHDGLLFPAGDHHALAGCLTRVLTDARLRARLAAAGKLSAARFDPDRHAARMAEVFLSHSNVGASTGGT